MGNSHISYRSRKTVLKKLEGLIKKRAMKFNS